MSNLSIGLIIGAALSSVFYSAIGSATSKISQLDKKGQSLKLGETIGKQFQEFRAETLRVRKEFEASGYKSKELGTKLKELQRSTQTARAEAQKYGFQYKKGRRRNTAPGHTQPENGGTNRPDAGAHGARAG